jgi:hemolysin-activating ACP:hemolysin acyltransferase
MITIQDLTYDIFQLDDMKMRIVISLYEKELGTLYFEKAKRAFTNKPVGMNSWACVDAKVEGLYVVGGEDITPKDIVAHCQSLLRTAGS